MNGQQPQQPYVQAQPAQTIYQQQPAPKKKHKFAKAVAIIAAVAIVGGGAGFGGAYLANSAIGTSSGTTASYADPGSTGGSSDNGSVSADGVNGNVSTALAAINSSNSNGGAAKTYPGDVIPTGANGEYTLSELYEAVNDTIVLIKVYEQDSASGYSYYDSIFGYGPGRDDTSNEPVYAGYGSGIVFTEDGYILTNAHVVEDSVKLIVEVNDYYDPDVTHEYEATIVGSDTSSDIAIIKIERDEPFLAAKLGDSDTLKVGQQIGVIGNPGVTADVMFSHTMTTGIVSGLDVECLATDGYSLSLIQTDAAINSGNSGGGMFDMYGNVVGVVNSKIIATTYEGIGFALTIDEAKPVMEDLLSYGYVKSRPVMGIKTVELSAYKAQLYGTKLTQGLLVSELRKGAPVERSGLKVGDIITKVNGVSVSSVKDSQTILSKFSVGDTVTVTVARENALGGLDSVDIDIELTETAKN